jgi:hypothetical protein
LGLENEITTVIVHDKDVGRWGQWKKVVSDECIATFMSPLYLPAALTDSLKVLPVPDIPIVGHFAQACRAEFARHPRRSRTPMRSPPSSTKGLIPLSLWDLHWMKELDDGGFIDSIRSQLQA